MHEVERLRAHRRGVQRLHQINGMNRFDARGVVYGKAVDKKGRPIGEKVLRPRERRASEKRTVWKRLKGLVPR